MQALHTHGESSAAHPSKSLLGVNNRRAAAELGLIIDVHHADVPTLYAAFPRCHQAIRIGAYHFFECSSKEGAGTDAIFQAAVAACLPPPATKWSWIPSFRKKKKPSRIQEAIDAPAIKRAEVIAAFASEHTFAAQSVAGDTYALDEWVSTADLHAALVQAHPSLGDGADFMLCEAETNREVQRGTFTPEQAMAMPSPGRFTLLFNAVQVQVQVQAAAADT